MRRSFDDAYYLDLQRRVRELLATLAGVLSTEDERQVGELNDHNEPGIAVEVIADTLVESGISPPPLAIEQIRALAQTMELTRPSIKLLTRGGPGT